MKMKRYFAPDSRQALRALRDDQGPDAVILSNRNVNGGVEIIAAMDYEESMENVALDTALVDNDKTNKSVGKKPVENVAIGKVDNRNESGIYKARSDKAGNDKAGINESVINEKQKSVAFVESCEDRQTRVNSADVDLSKQADAISFNNNRDSETFEQSLAWPDQEPDNVTALNKIKDELAGLRSIMEAPLMQFSWGETNRVRPLYASLLKQLMSLGLSSKLSQSIAKQMAKQGLTKQSWGESLTYLAKLLPVSQENIISSGGIVSLVGPTGVGKTTTIAKLAAHFALKYGRKSVTLITTDNYRIGAHEQLRSYGRILGIPVHVASDSAELKDLLSDVKESAGEHHLTLIDTAGVSQKDIHLTEQITSLDVDGIEIKNYLVLSATGQINLQHEVVNAFSKVSLSGCIVSKTDEAASLGEVISVLIEHRLPASYICNGQKVPDDIHQAYAKPFVKEAVNLMKNLNKSLTEEELAYTFGGVASNASF